MLCDKSLLELAMLKKKAEMDHDDKLLHDVELELSKRMLEASRKGRSEEKRKEAIHSWRIRKKRRKEK